MLRALVGLVPVVLLPRGLPAHHAFPRAAFSISAAHPVKAMPPRPKPPPDDELEEYFIHGSGPGGQKINKTSSAVQLIHKPTGLVVKSQATRSREQNRKIARELLAAKLDMLANGDKSRTAIVEKYKKKRADSSAKKSRRKYRKLEEEKANAEAEEASVEGEDAAAAEIPREQQQVVSSSSQPQTDQPSKS